MESEWIRRQGRVKQNARDTLKPNLSGNSAKRRVSRELLPTPEGPEMTRGRRKSVKGDMGNGGDEECSERAACQRQKSYRLSLSLRRWVPDRAVRSICGVDPWAGACAWVTVTALLCDVT